MGLDAKVDTEETLVGRGKPIEEGVKTMRSELGQKADEFLPELEIPTISKITKTGYISTVGYDARLDDEDGRITRAYMKDGRQLIVIRNRHGFLVPGAGMDMRDWQTYIYQFDGKDTITAIEPNGRTSKYSGEPGGNPDRLVAHFGQEAILGRVMSREQYVPPQPQPA